MVKNLPALQRDPGLIPGLGRFPWKGKWLLIPVFLPGESHKQKSLENPTNRGAWWATVHGITKSQT